MKVKVSVVLTGMLSRMRQQDLQLLLQALSQ